MSARPAPRLFVDAPLAPDAAVTLTEGQAHYLCHVMRSGLGDAVLAFNGQDGEWSCTLARISKRGAQLVALRQIREQTEPPDLWLLFAPIKRQRIDFIAEKATELGVRVLQPVMTRRTMVERVNLERLRAHAIEAAEQCGLLSVPQLRAPVDLERVMDAWDDGRRLIYCDESGDGSAALDVLKGASRGPWAVLIGPEGGFDPAERAYLRAREACLAVSLGPRIMRADTAAIAALALWQAVLGDWGQ